MAESDKREQILAAARFLILKQGLRATTMEAIAQQARIAKPTLYKYYGDKNSVFEALITELAVSLYSRVAEALEGEGDVIARVGAALAGKYEVVARLLEGSQHADELYNETDRAVAPQLQVADAEAETLIAAALARAGVKDARALTAVLLPAAYGIGRKAKSAEAIGPAMQQLVSRLVGPELPVKG